VTLGGDGLLGAVAGALAGDEGAVVGLLPGGRGNDFARVVGIPLDDVDAACAILRDGVERALDIGCVGDERFVGIASCGFDSDANRIANEAPARLGRLVYAYGALRALAAWKPATFALALDGEPPRSYRGYSVAFANSKAYGGGMYLAPDAELDDGLLDVVVTRQVSKLRFLRQLPKVFRGTHVHNPEVEVLRARSVAVSADRPFALYADGDPIGELPTTVAVLHRALRVLCPA
jgi:YegS/Rv2252/BmrU family lipid kinase